MCSTAAQSGKMGFDSPCHDFFAYSREFLFPPLVKFGITAVLHTAFQGSSPWGRTKFTF